MAWGIAMAYRIEPYVVRGELDNRVRGRVTGRIWLGGIESPLELELEGDAHPDLAGRVLTFARRDPADQGARLATVQRGEAGDLTASRKGRVLDVPVERAMEMSRSGQRPPEHLANVLYLEWFSEANGRVVIEATDFELSVSEPAWQPSPGEEAALRERAAGAFTRYVERLTQALEAREHRGPESYEDWDEFDFERVLRESDARTDKLGELLDKFGDDAGAEERIAREMGWSASGDADAPAGAEGESPRETFADFDFASVDAGQLEPDPRTEGVDWVRTCDGDLSHPLVERCSEGAVRLCQELAPDGSVGPDDPDLDLLLAEYQITTAKLAGALNGLAYGRDSQHPAFVVACLKRALGHLHAALSALAEVGQRRVLDKKIGLRVTAELFGIRESILGLMAEFRAHRPEDGGPSAG
jgi:hypothetical protein